MHYPPPLRPLTYSAEGHSALYFLHLTDPHHWRKLSATSAHRERESVRGPDDRLHNPAHCLAMATLWFKKRFQQSFDEKNCRLFPTQRHLFDFLDAPLSRPSDEDAGWLPFCIEMFSEAEASEMLSRPRPRPVPGASSPPDFVLFHRVSATVEAGARVADPTSGKKRPRGVVRKDYSLLYGEVLLSLQNRMFLACTMQGLDLVLSTIPPGDLHLYEIIREGTPCHLYFDVEREGDTVSVLDEFCIDSDEGSNCAVDKMVTASIHTRHGVHNYRATTSEYRRLLQQVPTIPPGTCPLDCPVIPDNSGTMESLLCALDEFVRLHADFLVFPGSDEDAHVDTEGGAGRVDLSRRLQQWTREVLVMKSSPLCPPTELESAPAKFSQHYVIKLRSHVFDSNISVGHFVRQFVEFMDRQCATPSPLIHRALFFHGEHILENVLAALNADQPSPAVLFVARKCVIDTAVYSRNRMMRCLGSCKLYKSSVLTVAAEYTGGSVSRAVDDPYPSEPRATLSSLCASLITVPPAEVQTSSLIHFSVAGIGGPGHFGGSTATGAYEAQPHEPLDGDASTVLRLEAAYRRISGCVHCTVSASRRLGGRFEVYNVDGTKFCQNVMREHRSNSVYLVLDTDKNSWAQKCFDPECAAFRSHPIPLE